VLNVITPGPEQPPAVLEWAVVDLLLGDEEFVREMFEAIVTAEWPSTAEAPPKNPPAVSGGTEGAGKPAPSPNSSTEFTAQRRRQGPGTDGWARERSPPGHPSAMARPKITGGDAPT